jgi:cold shock CspA family protein
MRVGVVVKLVHDKRFGFIRADNLRNDVLFRYSAVDAADQPLRWFVGQEVEFDLDDLKRLEFKELEASKVRGAVRPMSHRLVETEIPGMSPSHHPKARRRKPIWRKPEEETSPSALPDETSAPAPYLTGEESKTEFPSLVQAGEESTVDLLSPGLRSEAEQDDSPSPGLPGEGQG